MLHTGYRPEERRTIENQREPGIRELIGEDEASPEAQEKRHGLAYRRRDRRTEQLDPP